MKVSINVELIPFTVPEHVLLKPTPGKRQEGIKYTSIPLSSLSVEVLESMCTQFKEGVFENAGKKLPKHITCDLCEDK